MTARPISIADIQRRVARHYGVTRADMLSPCRMRPIARPRQIAMYLARQAGGHSLPQIGMLFGGRDHTTVLHAVAVIGALRASDAAIERSVAALSAQLGIVA
jgi:chromosomal replication initiator protein